MQYVVKYLAIVGNNSVRGTLVLNKSEQKQYWFFWYYSCGHIKLSSSIRFSVYFKWNVIKSIF